MDLIQTITFTVPSQFTRRRPGQAPQAGIPAPAAVNQAVAPGVQVKTILYPDDMAVLSSADIHRASVRAALHTNFVCNQRKTNTTYIERIIPFGLKS